MLSAFLFYGTLFLCGKQISPFVGQYRNSDSDSDNLVVSFGLSQNPKGAMSNILLKAKKYSQQTLTDDNYFIIM